VQCVRRWGKEERDVGNANGLARLKGLRGPLAPPALPSFPPSLSPISEVLFNARVSRHTNSIPFAAKRLPAAKEESRFMQCTEYTTLAPK